MAVYIILFILLILALNVYFLVNSKNEFHLKYLFKHLLVNFLLIALLAFAKNYSKGLDYTLFFIFNLQLLASVYLYYHVTSLLSGQKKKISYYSYIFFIVFSILFVLHKFDIHILYFNEKNIIRPTMYKLAIDQNNTFIHDIFPVKQIFQISYLMFIYFKVYTLADKSPSIKDKKKFKICSYAYLSACILTVLSVLFIYYNPFHLSNQVLGFIIKFNGGLSFILFLSYFIYPTLLISILKTKLYAVPEDTTTTFLQINNLIENNDMYLDSNISINEVSISLGLNASEVRNAIKNETNDNFNMYINTLRIAYSIDLLNNNYLNKHTIESLSAKCGFNSSQSFYRTFKKIKNVTPNEYNLKQKNKTNLLLLPVKND
jgi:AraC-like DNA-binding protein